VGCTNSIRARIKTLGSPDSYGETELCAPRNAYRSRSRFTTGIDTAISQGSAVEDSLPDVSGSRIVFNRLSAAVQERPDAVCASWEPCSV
jgi:hypothetical protein